MNLAGDKKLSEVTAGARSFSQSEVFTRTFSEGMTLVEDTANYLDTEGRKASKLLSRDGALAYASASMKLTTELMQIASWLLVLRAVREGDMEAEEARDDKYRLKPRDGAIGNYLEQGLPEKLIGLIEDSRQLYERIARLDGDLFTGVKADISERDAAAQQQALRDAFGDL